jgi:hypothetical protein
MAHGGRRGHTLHPPAGCRYHMCTYPAALYLLRRVNQRSCHEGKCGRHSGARYRAVRLSPHKKKTQVLTRSYPPGSHSSQLRRTATAISHFRHAQFACWPPGDCTRPVWHCHVSALYEYLASRYAVRPSATQQQAPGVLEPVDRSEAAERTASVQLWLWPQLGHTAASAKITAVRCEGTFSRETAAECCRSVLYSYVQLIGHSVRQNVFCLEYRCVQS